MTIKELIKKYGEGKGEATMWQSVEMISEWLDAKMSEEERECMERKMYALMQGRHYDEYFAKQQVGKMFFTDKQGEKHQAPYWTDDQVKQVWTAYKNKVMTDAGFWDFYVALNMTKADNCVLFRSWWPDADEALMTQRIAEATVNWLNDEDAPQGDARVWGYFNA